MASKCLSISVAQHGSMTPQTPANKGVGGSKVNLTFPPVPRARVFMRTPSVVTA